MPARVMGIVSLRAGLSPVGALLAGFGADLVGPRTTTIIFSVITAAIAVIVFLTSSTLRNYRLSQAMHQASGE